MIITIREAANMRCQWPCELLSQRGEGSATKRTGVLKPGVEKGVVTERERERERKQQCMLILGLFPNC